MSNLKGKVAELKAESALEERFPGYDFELAPSPTQPGWDLRGTSPDGEDILSQVKFGGEGYADDVVDAMREYPNFPFVVSSEIHAAIEESHPELLHRLIEMGSAAKLSESVEDNLDKLAGNFGVDLPDSLGDALPVVAEVVLGIKLIWGIVKTERQLADVDLTDRSRVHGIRALALLSRFGINRVCMWAGAGAGACRRDSSATWTWDRRGRAGRRTGRHRRRKDAEQEAATAPRGSCHETHRRRRRRHVLFDEQG